MKKPIALLTILLFCGASPSFAYVMGGSNLGYMGYPECKARVSWQPDEYEMDNYIREVKKYIENCDNDMRRIQEAKEDAIREANRNIDEYNRRRLGYY